MSIKLSGYLRDNPGGAAVPGKTVSLLDVNTGLAPATGTFTNLSGTTDVTDANGFWEFTMDFGTGPVYVSADLGGGNVRVRRNNEMFVYGAFNINQLPLSIRALNDGVVDRRTPGGTASTELAVTPSSVRVLAVSPGYAIIKGYLIGWDTGDKSLTGVANGAAGTTRHDFVVLRQWYTGTNAGKQDLVLVAGTSATDPVPTTTETDLTQYIRGATIWDLPIARGKLAFGSSLYTVENLRGSASFPFAGKHMTGNVGDLTAEDITATGGILVTGDATLRGTDVVVDTSGVTLNAPLLVGSYIKGAVTTPSVAPNAVNTTGAGAGATASIIGSDRSGQITLNMGTTPGVGRMLLVTMDTALPNTVYNIILIPKEVDSINNAGKFRGIPVSTTTWEIDALATPSSNQHIWGYVVEAY